MRFRMRGGAGGVNRAVSFVLLGLMLLFAYPVVTASTTIQTESSNSNTLNANTDETTSADNADSAVSPQELSHPPWNPETFSKLTFTTQSILQSCHHMIPPYNTYTLQLLSKDDENIENSASAESENKQTKDKEKIQQVEIKHRICNPKNNQYLEENEVDYLNHVIHEMESLTKISILDSTSTSTTSSEMNKGNEESDEKIENEEDIGIPVELAVVIVDEMDPKDIDSSMESGKNILIHQATTVATELHDTWGVGREEAGGTGILLFLSINDRTMYISTSEGVKPYLNDNRLDTIMDHMRSFLRQRNYAYAIHQAIVDIHESIHNSNDETRSSFMSSSLLESETLFSILVYGAFAVLIFISKWREERNKMTYMRVRTQLNRLDQERALALMGQYQPTSCPICLEDFEVVNGENDDGNDDEKDDEMKDTDQSEEQDIDAISMSDRDNSSTTSTLRRRNVSSTSDSIKENATTPSSEEQTTTTTPSFDHSTDTTSASSQSKQCRYLGKDGQSVKLLRCGHIFCQSCFDDWVQMGRSDVFKCPVCKQDISGSSPPNNNSSSASTSTSIVQNDDSTQDDRQDQAINPSNTTNNSETTATTTTNTAIRNATNNNSIQMNLYNTERTFRLSRLMTRYPRFIHQSQVSRWSSSTYDGQLSRDRDFIRRDPSIQHHSSSSSSSSSSGGFRSGGGFSSGGFGGGRSSGGRGGMW